MYMQGRREGVCLGGGQNVSLLLREPQNFAGGGGGLWHIFFFSTSKIFPKKKS